MKILIGDTETTGLIPKGVHYSTDFNEFPFIVSISWQLVDENQKVFIKEYRIIRPDGYEIPPEVVKIHGIDTDKAIKKGVELKTVLRLFITDCLKADKIVFHNAYFDISIIKANMLRLGIDAEIGNKALHKDKRVDTMRKTIKFVEATFEDGRVGKWPRLDELYEKLFNEEAKDLHSAYGDVETLKRCYFELIKLNIL